MQTVQLDIKDDKFNTFLTIIKNIKSGIIENIRTQDDILDIESIEKDSSDYLDLQNTKVQNNQKYNLNEAKKRLGF